MKTGGRQKGTPNKRQNPLKEKLRDQSVAYFEANVTIDDEETAALMRMPKGTLVSRFDIDMARMEPKDRVAIQERLLRYHTPQMQSVSAEVSLTGGTADTIEARLARLAAENDN